jgi:hypothetical protein
MNKALLSLLLFCVACGQSVEKGDPGSVTVVKKTGAITVTLIADNITPSVFTVDQQLKITIPHEIASPIHSVTGDTVRLTFGSVDCYYSNSVLSGLFEFQSCASGYTQFDDIALRAGEVVSLLVDISHGHSITVKATLQGVY